MSLDSPKKKTTAAQRYKKLFDLWMDESAPQGERDSAKRKADAWLRRHQKSWRDASSILAQAAADEAAAAPPPPPSDPRDGTAHPFDSSEFSPVGVVRGIVSKYVRMSSDHASLSSRCGWVAAATGRRCRDAPRLAGGARAAAT